MNSISMNYECVVSLNVLDTKSKKIKKQYNIHNEGSKTLFFFLCKCLIKEYDEQYAPLAIDAFTSYYREGESVIQSCLAYRVLLSNKSILKDVKITLEDNEIINYDYVARFSTIIPYSIITTGVNGGSIKCFQLHAKLSSSDKLDSLLAWINLEEGITINQDEALLIEWNMGFKNLESN